MTLSPHFTLEELTVSATASRLGIDNMPPPELIEHMKAYLAPGLEQVRAFLGQPMHINSGYRCPELNAATPGSSSTSQHTTGEAADFICPSYGSPFEICKAIIGSDIKFDQIIFEYASWCHISFSPKPRRHVLSKFTGTSYLAGLVEKPDVA